MSTALGVNPSLGVSAEAPDFVDSVDTSSPSSSSSSDEAITPKAARPCANPVQEPMTPDGWVTPSLPKDREYIETVRALEDARAAADTATAAPNAAERPTPRDLALGIDRALEPELPLVFNLRRVDSWLAARARLGADLEHGGTHHRTVLLTGLVLDRFLHTRHRLLNVVRGGAVERIMISQCKVGKLMGIMGGDVFALVVFTTSQGAGAFVKNFAANKAANKGRFIHHSEPDFKGITNAQLIASPTWPRKNHYWLEHWGEGPGSRHLVISGFQAKYVKALIEHLAKESSINEMYDDVYLDGNLPKEMFVNGKAAEDTLGHAKNNFMGQKQITIHMLTHDLHDATWVRYHLETDIHQRFAPLRDIRITFADDPCGATGFLDKTKIQPLGMYGPIAPRGRKTKSLLSIFGLRNDCYNSKYGSEPLQELSYARLFGRQRDFRRQLALHEELVWDGHTEKGVPILWDLSEEEKCQDIERNKAFHHRIAMENQKCKDARAAARAQQPNASIHDFTRLNLEHIGQATGAAPLPPVNVKDLTANDTIEIMDYLLRKTHLAWKLRFEAEKKGGIYNSGFRVADGIDELLERGIPKQWSEIGQYWLDKAQEILETEAYENSPGDKKKPVWLAMSEAQIHKFSINVAKGEAHDFEEIEESDEERPDVHHFWKPAPGFVVTTENDPFIDAKPKDNSSDLNKDNNSGTNDSRYVPYVDTGLIDTSSPCYDPFTDKSMEEGKLNEAAHQTGEISSDKHDPAMQEEDLIDLTSSTSKTSEIFIFDTAPQTPVKNDEQSSKDKAAKPAVGSSISREAAF